MRTKIDDVVHQMDDGRWIVAYWDDRSAQWRSSDIDEPPFPNYLYSCAGSLQGLANLGIRTYATREKAEAAARECYLIAEETD